MLVNIPYTEHMGIYIYTQTYFAVDLRPWSLTSWFIVYLHDDQLPAVVQADVVEAPEVQGMGIPGDSRRRGLQNGILIGQ
jgi:hypothetical protein